MCMLGCIVDTNLSNEVAVIAQAQQQVREDVNNVRLENATQDQAEHLEPEKRTCNDTRHSLNPITCVTTSKI